MADVRITQYPLKSVISDNDIFLIADSNDIDVNGFPKYKKVRAKDLPSIVNTAENITYANLMASIAANDLIIGTFYRITDSTSGVSPLLVQAVGVNAISYQAFDGANPLNTINYNVATDTIRWNKNQTNPPQDYLSGSGIVKSTAGTISYLADNSTNWNTAFNNSIVSAAVTGSATKTLTLNQQDGGTVTASWSDIDTGLTSVGLSMPSAFTVSNSPLTANGTLAVTGAGVASQYVRGDGTLASFPTSTGGGSSVSYYFNGGTSQGVIGGNTYYEMSKNAIIGTGADFSINADGYVAQFVTDANDPSLLSIPAGNWNFEMWFSASSGGGTPSFYLELYKYDGATLTLISSGSAAPEAITGGTAIDLYTTALAVPLTTLALTDRLAVRVYVNHSSKTITLHTQNGHLCQAITTFSTGLTALNGLTSQVQYLAVGTSGTDFSISSATSTHTFNLPTASAANRGALSSADWTTFNGKQNALTNPITGTGTTNYLPKFTGASALGNSLFQEGTSAIGLGVTPSTWVGTSRALQIGTRTALWDSGGAALLGYNVFNDGANKYLVTAPAMRYFMSDAGHTWNIAPSGTAGGALTFTTAMALDTSGRLGIGTATPASKLEVQVATAGTSIIGFFNNTDFTAANKSAIRVRQQTGASTGFSAYLGMDGNTLFISNDTTATNHLAISTTGAVTLSSTLSTVGDATINGVKVGKGAGNIATNTALGFEAINANVSATGVTALGYQALRASTGGSNTGVGYQALLVNSTATQNTAVGFLSLAATTTGASNTAVGSQALTANISGANNTALGRSALAANTAANNTAVGFEAASANTSAVGITAIGYQSLKASTGANNTALGFQSLLVNSTGTNNTALGDRALTANTTGITNTAIGQAALFTNIVGNNNTAIGTSALFTSTGSANTAIGSSALLNNTASNNTAVGFESASANTSATGITAIGYQALKASTGANNTALGGTALTANTTGTSNTAIGFQSLLSNTTGIENTAIGVNSLVFNVIGNYNTAIGRSSLQANTASNNTAVGFEAAKANTTGTGITAIGHLSLTANTTGNNNTALGFGTVSGNFSGSLILGKDATATANNQFVVGSTGTNAGTVATEVNASSKVWNVIINGVAQKILLA